MLRSWDLLVYVLCVLCMGQRFAIGQTTSTSTTLLTTEAGSVCTVDTADQATCNSATEATPSDGSSSSDCTDQETWTLEVNATAGITVTFTGRQPVLVLNTTADGVTTFQYNVSCCYDVTVDGATSNTMCTLDVYTSQSPTPAALSFDEDTFAHVAIGCGGGIVVMLCLVFALGAICNKDQKKQAAKYKENAGNQQRKAEQPRPPSQLQDTPRRPALDAVFDTGQRHGPHAAGYSDRPMPDPRAASSGGPPNRGMPDPRLDPRSAPNVGHADRGMPDPREQSYGYDRPPYDDPRGRDYDDGYDNLSFQHDDYERPRPPREHQREQMRRHTEAPPHGPPRYDNHGEAARNFNDPYDGYDRYDRPEGNRHGRYSEMPQYDRGMRSGPPADFDMY
ncbi:uncharacterized protein LOC144864996 [Branchiostoma floridae x Branchiostoma japonicum]